MAFIYRPKRNRNIYNNCGDYNSYKYIYDFFFFL